MPRHDLFGLADESKINRSGVRDVFTPHQPIGSAQLLLGRESEVKRLLQHLSTPGQHVLLYGDRGVGKTSLANITRLLVPDDRRVVVCRCDSMTSFRSLILRVLAALGMEAPAMETKSVHTEGGDARVGIGPFGAGVHAKNAQSATRPGVEQISPSWAVDQLGSANCLLLIDEADAIRDKGDLLLLAEFVKLLSDAASIMKVMIVGIASTGEELTAGHESVVRCLKQTKLAEMSAGELTGIIVQGGSKLGLDFHNRVRDEIVDISAGYPHFTHLLALKSAEAAVVADTKVVTLEHLTGALEAAAEDAEASLRDQFEAAVRSQKRERYEALLFAAAQLGKSDFRAAEWRGAYLSVTGLEITQNALNNYLGTLVGATVGDGKIMYRTGHGIYRFSDPRMASFIRIRLGTNSWP